MRRSSWVILTLALALLGALGVFYLHSFNTTAPPMSAEVARALVENGKAALAKRDTGAIVDLFAPGAKIFDRSPDQMRLILNRVMHEVSGHLDVTTDRYEVKQQGSSAFVAFDMDVGQKTNEMEASYYRARIRLELVKVRASRWFGLFTTEDWKVLRAESSESLDVPTP